MTLTVHRSQRADQLVEGLAGLLSDPLPDPFVSELVIVPAKGIERWLSQRLSHRLGPSAGGEDGVCAGVQFRSPGSLISEILGRADDDPWQPEALVWPLLAVIDACIDETWAKPVVDHLGLGLTGEEAELRQGRRYAVARRLAWLFASYATQRPTLLSDWEAGRDSDGHGGDLAADLLWQAELWRRLVAAVGGPSPVERQGVTCARLRDDPAAFGLPARFSFFGHTRIPASEIELLEALAAHHDVHLWLSHPSDALWQALAERDLQPTLPRVDDQTHRVAAHPLLAGLGRDVRELQRRLGSVEGLLDGGDAPIAEAGSVLGHLQADLAGNSLPVTAREITDGDRSIQVHACHGPARQVEVLREVIVGLLADDPTLQPRDIVVMCPDIEAYAPLITAAFGLGDLLHGRGHPGQELRVQLADRALTQTNPLLGVALAMLDLAGGRAEASRVLDLLALDPVRRRFGFAEDDLDRIATWIDQAGIKWAFDESHRAGFGLDGVVQNTWSFGLDRILAGAAISEDVHRWFGRTLPLDDVSSTDIDLAGRLAEAVARVRHLTDQLSGSHGVEHWLRVLADGIESVTAVGFGDEWQLGQVHRELLAVGDVAATGTALRLPDVRALLEERFRGRPTRANFRTGALTVCTMTPMRSVPHRVVCLLGLDDGSFPRPGGVDGDDVLARRPLTGERDLRSEDRQLMLDSVLAARDHLVVTYTGASESTGQPRPPSAPLKELLDVLDLSVVGGHERVLVRHPLQAFDASNLAGPTPFSFDRSALAGARAAAAPRVSPERLAEVSLAAPSGDIDLAELLAFLKAPVRTFLRRRLEIALPEEADSRTDAIPVGLDGLATWQVGDRMLRDILSGVAPDDALQMVWRRGVLPPGQLGWRQAGDLVSAVQPIAEATQAAMGGLPARAVDVDIALGDGRRLIGTIGGIHGERVLSSSYSRVGAKHELEAWLHLLVLEVANPGRGWSAGAIGRGGRGRPWSRVVFGSAPEASQRLAEIVALYDAGMRGPLPLPVKTAHAYAVRRQRVNARTARFAAKDQWHPGKWSGEDVEPAHLMVWGDIDIDSLFAAAPEPGEEWGEETSRLGALACRLWMPILAARTES